LRRPFTKRPRRLHVQSAGRGQEKARVPQNVAAARRAFPPQRGILRAFERLFYDDRPLQPGTAPYVLRSLTDRNPFPPELLDCDVPFALSELDERSPYEKARNPWTFEVSHELATLVGLVLGKFRRNKLPFYPIVHDTCFVELAHIHRPDGLQFEELSMVQIWCRSITQQHLRFQGPVLFAPASPTVPMKFGTTPEFIRLSTVNPFEFTRADG